MPCVWGGGRRGSSSRERPSIAKPRVSGTSLRTPSTGAAGQQRALRYVHLRPPTQKILSFASLLGTDDLQLTRPPSEAVHKCARVSLSLSLGKMALQGAVRDERVLQGIHRVMRGRHAHLSHKHRSDSPSDGENPSQNTHQTHTDTQPLHIQLLCTNSRPRGGQGGEGRGGEGREAGTGRGRGGVTTGKNPPNNDKRLFIGGGNGRELGGGNNKKRQRESVVQ